MSIKLYEEFFSEDTFFNYPNLSEFQNPATNPDFEEETGKEYLVSFSTQASNYCVGVVDMVNSTEICAKLGTFKAARYYQIFLNSMSKILSRFGGFVIKNVGDCLFYYFPESCHSDKKFGFLSCLECSFAMLEAREFICQKLLEEGLPPVSYRISIDYGSVIMMKQNSSDSVDMIGPPLNISSKINRFASPNNFVIGSDLRQMVKNFGEYSFKQIASYNSGFKFDYPVFSVRRSSKN